jgi:hypothetical protein
MRAIGQAPPRACPSPIRFFHFPKYSDALQAVQG